MKTFEKLSVRIKNDLNIELNSFKRERVGYLQRSKGAWVWSARRLGYVQDYGSSFSATDILKSKKPLLILGQEIIVD